jgi:hypothetical protein
VFDSIAISRHAEDPQGPPIDTGVLAEALVFYQRVAIHGHGAMLRHLLKACGATTVDTLVTEGHLTFAYDPGMAAISTHSLPGGAESHAPVSVTVADAPFDRVVRDAFMEATNKPGVAKRMANRFLERSSEHAVGKSVLESAVQDLKDSDLLRLSVRAVLETLAPDYGLPDPLDFGISETRHGIQVHTNIDFTSANAAYHKQVSPSHSSLSAAYLLATVLSTREQLGISSELGAELVVTPVRAKVISVQLGALLDQATRSQPQVSRFQEFAFANARALRESVSAGQHSIADLIPVLEKAKRWKEWLVGRPESTDLVQEYYQSLVSQTWLDRLPTKVGRWSIFTALGLGADMLGAGGLGTILGVAISAADATLVERLIHGWRPHQFVEGPLRAFVTPPERPSAV